VAISTFAIFYKIKNKISIKMAASTTPTTILLIVMVIFSLIIFIVSIIQLYEIRKTVGYSLNSSLQTAYDFSIGVLVLSIFLVLFYISALVIYIRHHSTRSGSLVACVIFGVLTLFAGVIVGGYAAAASNNAAAIGNEVVMVIAFIVGIVLIVTLRKLDVYVAPDVAPHCSNIIAETATASDKEHVE
jgi:hypothetical protein